MARFIVYRWHRKNSKGFIKIREKTDIADDVEVEEFKWHPDGWVEISDAGKWGGHDLEDFYRVLAFLTEPGKTGSIDEQWKCDGDPEYTVFFRGPTRTDNYGAYAIKPVIKMYPENPYKAA
uniref:Uncharacterized protein n=1 Tax=viral metagenome TaxID=1070528 RepID=A0A6M3JN47_9ZZZZ